MDRVSIDVSGVVVVLAAVVVVAVVVVVVLGDVVARSVVVNINNINIDNMLTTSIILRLFTFTTAARWRHNASPNNRQSRKCRLLRVPVRYVKYSVPSDHHGGP